MFVYSVKFRQYNGWSKGYTYLSAFKCDPSDYVLVPDTTIEDHYILARVAKELTARALKPEVTYKQIARRIGPSVL